MNELRGWHSLGIFLGSALVAGLAWAETIELVTYYPAPLSEGQGNLHVRSVTVGSSYAGVIPADGEALVFRRAWIGPGFVSLGTGESRPLQVSGEDDKLSKVTFVRSVVDDPGTSSHPDLFVGIGTADPQALLHIRQDGDAAYVRIEGVGITGENFSGLELRSVEGVPRIWQLAHKREGGFGARNDFHIAYRDENGAWHPYVTVKTNGNIGLGVENADKAKLHIQENADGIWAVRMANRNNSRNWAMGVDAVSIGDGKFWIGDATLGAGRFVLDPAGNAGIGTPNPNGTAPPGNGQTSSNLDVNDVWLRNSSRWVSQLGKTGSYTGDGTTKTLNVGFKPKSVTLLAPKSGSNGPYMIMKFDTIPSKDGLLLQPSGSSPFFGEVGLAIKTDGFEVNGTSNLNGLTYYYSATS